MYTCMRLTTSDGRFATANFPNLLIYVLLFTCVRVRFATSDIRFASQVNLDVCLQNIEKVRKKFAVANRPSGVVSRIHVYIHLVVVILCGCDMHVNHKALALNMGKYRTECIFFVYTGTPVSVNDFCFFNNILESV